MSVADAPRAIRALLEYGRPWAAIDLLTAQLHGTKDDPPASVTPVVVVEVLDAALLADHLGSQSQSPGYEVGILLDYLASKGMDPAQLARYEFASFRLLENYRTPRALFQVLASNPLEFVDLVQRVYREKSEPDRQLDEHDEALARHAWWVLAHWDAEFPGLRRTAPSIKRSCTNGSATRAPRSLNPIERTLAMRRSERSWPVAPMATTESGPPNRYVNSSKRSVAKAWRLASRSRPGVRGN
jgi:hypothetical protein